MALEEVEFEVPIPEPDEAAEEGDMLAPPNEREAAKDVCKYLVKSWKDKLLPPGLEFKGPECVLFAASKNRLVRCEDALLERSTFVIADLQGAYPTHLPGGKLPCPLCKKSTNVLSKGALGDIRGGEAGRLCSTCHSAAAAAAAACRCCLALLPAAAPLHAACPPYTQHSCCMQGPSGTASARSSHRMGGHMCCTGRCGARTALVSCNANEQSL